MRTLLFLLLVSVGFTALSAKESVEADMYAVCTDAGKKEFRIEISSNSLNLSEDAVQDNLGGYVDIPEDRYYLKTDNAVYHLSGAVEKNFADHTDRFVSYINNNSEKFINTEELYRLKTADVLKFIQKIKLDEHYQTDSFSNDLKINILDVSMDEKSVDEAYQKCEEQMNRSEDPFDLQTVLLILFILLITYAWKRRF